MKILIIWLASFALAGIIISPFFWLRFLKKKGIGTYLVASSIATLGFLFAYIYPIDNFLSNWTAKTNANLYYFYDDFSLYPILIVIFLIVISPFIFTKIIKNKLTIKSFFVSLFLSLVIFVAIFLYWAYVLLPKAFNQLHNYF